MNNYISLNLVSGKLGRLAGGGKPTFVLGEQNEVQLYILDYAKPITYPADSLSDAYAAEIIPVNYNSKSVILKAGTRGGSSILSTSSFSNLPNSISFTSSSGFSINTISNNAYSFKYEGAFSYSSIPSSGSVFRFKVSLQSGAITSELYSQLFSYDTSIKDLTSILRYVIEDLSFNFFNKYASGSYSLLGVVGEVVQISDTYFSFYFSQGPNTFFTTPASIIFSCSVETVSGSSNYGKYGQLDFSSPSWNSIIGSKNEKEIWMEAMIGSDTISQGTAKICRKMT